MRRLEIRPAVLAGAALAVLALGLIAALVLRQPDGPFEALPVPPVVSAREQAQRDSAAWTEFDKARGEARERAETPDRR